MVLKATANDGRHLALCHDEFGRPRSGLCRSGGIGINNNRSTSTHKILLIHPTRDILKTSLGSYANVDPAYNP
ncbi:hypothetical protein TNCV_2615851 [Trichonephila clavipes]|nr:hypothetical protein TNCV_2615851 [Trichonephila clavipes]